MALSIRSVEVDQYRSLRRLRLPLNQLTVFTGANGAGKTNLYRALQLLRAAAEGRLAYEIALEGGLAVALWAGKRNPRQPVRVRLAITLDAGAAPSGYETLEYVVEIGLPQRTPDVYNPFSDEAEIKSEQLVGRLGRRSHVLLERSGPALRGANEAGQLQLHALRLLASETALASLDEPDQHPELHLVRRTLLGMRFIDELRTDRGSAVRRPSLTITTPTLAPDGSDLAAIFATVAYVRRDTADLDEAVKNAFPGVTLHIDAHPAACTFGLADHAFRTDGGEPRVFGATELSEGTLRYLTLVGALLSFRPPAFIALNEPEASLHPDLVEPFARLIFRATRHSQLWVVTHSPALAEALQREARVRPWTAIKTEGETRIKELGLSGERVDDEDDD